MVPTLVVIIAWPFFTLSIVALIVLSCAVDSIKSQSGNGPSGDSPSLFDIIVILLLGALTIISTLAMLSSRSTLKIMGDKVK